MIEQNNITIRELLEKGQDMLDAAGLPTSRFDSEAIVADVLQCPRLDMLVNQHNAVSNEARERITTLLQRRREHQPLQYLLKKAYFRNLELVVGPGVLVPRPETELIIDLVSPHLKPGSRVCDIGTGSGAIILSIASEFPFTSNIGVDLHSQALQYAIKNKVLQNISNVHFLLGNLLTSFRQGIFDLIIANLPYISDDEYRYLPRDVREHEPVSALVSGPDGLNDIRELLKTADRFLKPGGIVLLEIGETQAGDVVHLLEKNSNFYNISVKKDLNSLDRFVLAIKLS